MYFPDGCILTSVPARMVPLFVYSAPVLSSRLWIDTHWSVRGNTYTQPLLASTRSIASVVTG